jgi:hypothetical protein
MDKTIHPTINHANSPLLAKADSDSDSISSSEPNGTGTSGNLWRSTLENQARFVSEYTNDVLAQMARNRLLVANQLKQMSAHSERMVSLMAHTACRTLAIATHARRKNCDRRIFSLPLPDERRFENQTDRRKFMSGDEPL